MKILMVNKYFNVHGGSETYFFGLAELLKKAGHEVIFFSMQDKKNLPCAQSEYFVSNVEFNGDLSLTDKMKAALRMVYSFEAKKKITALIEKEKPDVIHINLFHRVLTASIVDAAKKYDLPVVFTMHDLNCICPNHVMLDHGEICEDCLHGNYLNCIKRVCFKESRAKCMMAALESQFNKQSGLYNKIDLFITPSEFYKRKMQESGLTRSPIVHMKNFLPAQTVYSVQGTRGKYVLYYGRLSREKGILTLVRAMKKIQTVPLVIIGTGPEEETIRQEVHRLGLEDRVTLAGFKSGETLWRCVRESACVVVPSEWYEASGYTACEAQAMGKPVIATDAGGLPENLVDGETGFVCEMKNEAALAEAIKKVMGLSENSYNEMAQKAAVNAKRLFDADLYVVRMTQLYQELMQEKSASKGLVHSR